ncbi:MAG: hypothetical protein GY866_12250 [Proteobacteria bacterium]|nr:hypothetical protein [Pseudomonadota bacterium]
MNSSDIVKELEPLFEPNSVAVVGATNNITKWGYSTFSSIKSEFKGKLFAVNNKAEEVLGVPAYSNITDVPGAVDLAVIVVPAEAVGGVMRDCVEKGVKAAVVISAGFAETGPEGKALQDDMMDAARSGGIRVVGPNCMGMWSAVANLPAFMFPMTIMDGPLALVSQGGNIGSALVADGYSRGIGFRQYISCGCTADIQIEDYIEYLGRDDSVEVIMVYIEGLNDGKRFVEKVAPVTRKKPVVALKPGKTEAAAQAISSHSGSMSGADSIYDAAFKKAGVLRVETTMELLDVAIAHLFQPLPEGPNVVIITPGGSYGVMCADACALQGLNVIDLPADIMEAFNGMFPSRWSHGNPVDPAGDRDMIQYFKAPEMLLERPEVDALMFMGFGSFSGVSSVFASGGSKWNLIENIKGIKDLANHAHGVLESGDRVRIQELFKTLLTMTLKVVMTTGEEELLQFIDTLSEALTTEKMLKRSFFNKLKKILKAMAAGRLKRVRMEDIAEMLEPIIDAVLERWIVKYGKPVITTTFTEGTARISEVGHFPYPNSQQAALVLAKLLEYREYRES